MKALGLALPLCLCLLLWRGAVDGGAWTEGGPSNVAGRVCVVVVADDSLEHARSSREAIEAAVADLPRPLLRDVARLRSDEPLNSLGTRAPLALAVLASDGSVAALRCGPIERPLARAWLVDAIELARDDGADALQSARRSMLQGGLVRAENAFHRALATPRANEARAGLAWCLAERGDLEAARAWLGQVDAADASAPHVDWAEGRIAHRARETSRALSFLARAHAATSADDLWRDAIELDLAAALIDGGELSAGSALLDRLAKDARPAWLRFEARARARSGERSLQQLSRHHDTENPR